MRLNYVAITAFRFLRHHLVPANIIPGDDGSANGLSDLVSSEQVPQIVFTESLCRYARALSAEQFAQLDCFPISYLGQALQKPLTRIAA